MTNDRVEDEEILYRRIGSDYYQLLPDGTARMSSSAFSDRSYKISVDRANLCGHNPAGLRKDVSDGVAKVQAGTVRTCPVSKKDSKGRLIQDYPVEISADPLPDNPAHAVIHTDPIESTVFNKLSVWLSRNAKWDIRPYDDL